MPLIQSICRQCIDNEGGGRRWDFVPGLENVISAEEQKENGDSYAWSRGHVVCPVAEESIRIDGNPPHGCHFVLEYILQGQEVDNHTVPDMSLAEKMFRSPRDDVSTTKTTQ